MLALVLAAQLAALPNPILTPGAVRPYTTAQVCGHDGGLDNRYVSLATKRHVAFDYGIPESDWPLYEFDHEIAHCLGGDDGVLNIWPQPLQEARLLKDPLEIRLCKMVCAGTVTLRDAQEALRKDWLAADLKYPRKAR